MIPVQITYQSDQEDHKLFLQLCLDQLRKIMLHLQFQMMTQLLMRNLKECRSGVIAEDWQIKGDLLQYLNIKMNIILLK